MVVSSCLPTNLPLSWSRFIERSPTALSWAVFLLRSLLWFFGAIQKGPGWQPQSRQGRRTKPWAPDFSCDHIPSNHDVFSLSNAWMTLLTMTRLFVLKFLTLNMFCLLKISQHSLFVILDNFWISDNVKVFLKEFLKFGNSWFLIFSEFLTMWRFFWKNCGNAEILDFW